MPRVVLDTNVVVSAHLNAAGLERAVLNWALEQGFFVSDPILEEYGDVLRRTKLKIDSGLVTESLSLIRAQATLVSPTRKVTVSRDPDDNRFLECAEAAHADYLVTGNKRHFPASYKNTRVVDAREFLDLIDPASKRGL
jgi:putative PIN family toxin of toxin-antitoxin system